MTRRVFDSFNFAGELDLLECRLTELYDSVRAFVIVESNLTYSGLVKPLWFAENASRFGAWSDKIRYVIAECEPGPSPAVRESAQRQAAWDALGDYEAGDVLVQGDADEIPHPGDLAFAADGTRPPAARKIMHRHHPVAVNLVDSTPWGGYVPHLGPGRPHMMELRQRLHSRIIPEVQGRGWHFSWLGGPEAMKAKAATLCEPDYLPKMLNGAEDFYRLRVNPGSGDRHLAVAEIDGTWPRFMQQRRGPVSWYWPGEAA
jgi:beta-1,4-mannosyl-glycoprotein beta-1,4-N-acetylglucosaminyltransferase